jgi:protein TonB
MNYLAYTVRYPAIDRENGTMGKVVLSFFVEKNGQFSHIKILRAPSKSIRDEILRVMNLSPDWTIGKDYGIPASRQYTVPFMFSLADDR